MEMEPPFSSSHPVSTMSSAASPVIFMQNEGQGRTLQTTALVHEADLRLIDVTNVDWQHRAHFFAISATMMRRILLDRARKRQAAKRGGKLPRVNLEDIPDV